MQVISGVNNSAFFAQSAYSAATATFDKNGNDIAETYYPANNPSAFITGVDLTPYQTTAGMTGYLTTADSANFYTNDNPSGFITGVDLSDYATTAQLAEKLDTTAFSDVSGTFLTAHQDISNKLDTTAFSDVSGSFLTSVPDTYLQNTDLTTEDGKVTAISGIPLSAGDELPSGVMVESAVEYNAVNEISGYNGSAIAQYGAEKQWLVHDDTLVHAANSAQYALGVNLSAVAQLLGVDETVLWSNTAGKLTKDLTFPLTLNETIANFKRVKFLYGADASVQYAHWIEFEATNDNTYTLYDFRCDGPADNQIFWRLAKFNINGTAVTNTYNSVINLSTAFGGYGFNTDGYNYLVQIVGIGRKQ